MLTRPGAPLPHGSLLDTRRPRLLLTLFCLLLWLPGFFTLPPGDRDESRFVQATKQMLETSDFVRIMNGDVPRNRKPIGIHWLQAPFAAAAEAAGLARENPVWPYRIPSLLGGLVAVLATFWAGRALVGERAALLGAGALAASVALTVEVHIAKTDAALLGATMLAMGVLARAALDPTSVRPRHAALFWLAMGVGVLLKGPITPMIALLAAATLEAWERRGRWLLALRPGWGVPLMLIVVLPWFAAIGAATEGRFFEDAVGGDLGRKLAGGDDDHWGPPGLHLLLLPLLLFPASAALPGALLGALRAAWEGSTSAPTRVLLAWIVPAWLVFELAPTKLPHYTLPLLPPLCLLLAAWALDPARAGLPRRLAALPAALVLLAAAALGGGALALPLVLGEAAWIGVPGLLAAGLAAWLALRDRNPARAVTAGLAAAPLVYAAVLGWELPRLRPLWIAPQVVEALASLPAPPGTRLGAVGFHEPSLMFLAGTGTRWLPTGWDGARALASGEVGRVLVGDRDMAAFGEEAARLGLATHALAEVDGFNYSRGRRVKLTLLEAGAKP